MKNKIVEYKWFILVVVTIMVSIIIGLVSNQKKSLAEENYAYKDIVGIHSPYLIDEDKEKYIVDEPLVADRYSELEYAEFEPYPDGDGYSENNPKPVLSEIDTFKLNTIKRDQTLLYTIGDDTLSFIDITDDDSWEGKEEEKKIDDWTMQMSSDSYHSLKENAWKLIESNFNWDYRNKNNRDDFLSFRVQNKIYKDRVLSVDIMYDRIIEDIKKNKIIMKVDYLKEDISVYVNPKVGGWMVECPILLTVREGREVRKFKMDYMARLGFGTPNERDVWKLWTTASEGVQMVADDYVRNIEEVKNE